MAAPLRIAVDTGGTFTDFVWTEGGRLRTIKLFSTREDPSRSIVEGVTKIAGGGDAVVVLHGTTVGTNALLERKGARVALITTAGFEDAIEIGRQARPRLYDLDVTRPEPLVPAELRFGVEERTRPDGTVERAAAAEPMQKLAAKLRDSGMEAIAICLLFSFANPANEEAVAAALRDAKVTAPLSISHKLLPEFREYERMSTVVVNAYLQPLMQRYLTSLGERVQQSRKQSSVFVMQSSGGITPLATAAAEPVRTVLSGPAGGAIGALRSAGASKVTRVISFDMGGTSTDVALLDGAAHTSNEAEIAGLPVRVPMLKIHTVGAGGGSLARFDAGGALRVGPESAGAEPGPICYGRGTAPTVTDANLLLGRLRSAAFLGGGFTLDLERTRALTREWLAKNASGLKWTPEQLASGILRVVNATMEKALRVVSLEQGFDPREFTLVAFGGAGPLHACELAEVLSIPRVLVPAMPGALSAYGILMSDVVKDLSRTVLTAATKAELTRFEQSFRALEDEALRQFAAEGWKGKPRLERSADVRYAGQGYELNVPWSKQVLEGFHAEHKRKYGYSRPEAQVEVVNLRLRAVLPQTSAEAKHQAVPGLAKAERVQVFFGGKQVATPIVARESLKPGRWVNGPMIITEYSATTVVPPRTHVQVDRAGNLILELAKKKSAR